MRLPTAHDVATRNGLVVDGEQFSSRARLSQPCGTKALSRMTRRTISFLETPVARQARTPRRLAANDQNPPSRRFGRPGWRVLRSGGQDPTRERSGVPAIVDNKLAVDQHIRDSDRVLMWILEAGLVGNRGRIEDGDIGNHTVSDQAPI